MFLRHHFWFHKEPLKPGLSQEPFPQRLLQRTDKGASKEKLVLQSVMVLHRTTKPLKKHLRTIIVLCVGRKHRKLKTHQADFLLSKSSVLQHRLAFRLFADAAGAAGRNHKRRRQRAS